MKLSGFSSLYDEAKLTAGIRRSMTIVIFANICNKLFTLITSGTAMTGFARTLGANDLMYGLLTAIPFLATIIQIPASVYVMKTGKRKQSLLKFGLIARVLWLMTGIVPFFVPLQPNQLCLWTVIFLVGVVSAGNAFYSVCFNSWLADLIPASIRGRWFCTRDRIILILNLGISLGIARLLDLADDLTGYCLIFIVAGIIGIIDIVLYFKVEDIPMQRAARPDFAGAVNHIVHDKDFLKFIIFWIVWLLSSYMCSPYVTYYALYSMNLTFTDITIYGTILGNIVTIILITYWGRMIDRKGNRYTMLVSGIGTAISPALLLLAKPGSILAYVLYNMFGAAFWEVPYLVSNNMMLCNSPEDQRPAYIAVFSCITSILGSFVGTMFGGSFLSWVPGLLATHPIVLFGEALDQYKFLFLLSAVIRLLTVVIFVPMLKKDIPEDAVKEKKVYQNQTQEDDES